MRVSLLEICEPGDNKEYNGGYGTTFKVGSSLRARLLQFIRARSEYFPVLSLGYLAAVLKAGGHEVTLDINCVRHDVDLVIIHASLIRHREECAALAELRSNPRVRTCVVGPLASTEHERFLPLADTVVKGDVERPFLTLASSDGLPQGLIESEPLDDLDELPFPDWSVYKFRDFSQRPILQGHPSAFIQASRSCPYKCNYCPYIVMPGSYRRRRVECVVEELRAHKERYGFTAMMFRDPVFTLDRKWTLRLCEALIEADLKLELGCETRTDRLDEELIDALYSAGFRAFKVGVESPNSELLGSHGRRPPTHEQQERMVRYAEARGIIVVAFFMLGLPDDTPATMQATLDYSLSLGTSLANFTICTPIPGTKFYREVRDDILVEDWNRYDNFHPVFKTRHLSAHEIKGFQEKSLVSFYFRWGFLKRHGRQRVAQLRSRFV